MNKIILNKNVNYVEGKAVVTSTVEETYTKEELARKKSEIAMRKQGLINQSKNLKEQFDQLILEDTEIDNMILALEETTAVPVEEQIVPIDETQQ